MTDTMTLSPDTSVSTFGYQGGWEALGEACVTGGPGHHCANPGAISSRGSKPEPKSPPTLPISRPLYAHKVPLAPAVEYFEVPDDEPADDLSGSADTTGLEINAALREIGVILHLKSASARVRGDDTRPLIRPRRVLSTGRAAGVWIAQQRKELGGILGSARTLRKSLGAIRRFSWLARRAQLLDKLAGFRKLEKGWDSYAAPAPSAVAVENARGLVTSAFDCDIIPERVEPSAMGGVGVTLTRGPREVVVEFFNGGKAHALFADDVTGAMDTRPVPPTADGYRELIDEARTHLYGKHRPAEGR